MNTTISILAYTCMWLCLGVFQLVQMVLVFDVEPNLAWWVAFTIPWALMMGVIHGVGAAKTERNVGGIT